MPTVALHPTPPSNLMHQQQQHPSLGPPKPQLRRAVYVHVSDLLSAYNIDHAKLEEELQRVKQNKNVAAVAPSSESSSAGSSTLTVPTELDTNPNPKKLQPPRGGFNLCVLVGNVDLVVDKHRVDGSRVRLAEVEVGDETGRVSLRARDDQIDLLQSVAPGAVVLRNCTLELFQGKHIRLAVTKWGKITPYPDHVASTPVPPSKMNEDRFFSLIDLSVVAMDVAPADHQQYQQMMMMHAAGGGYHHTMAENDGYGGSRGGGRGGMGRNKQARSKQQPSPQSQQQQAPALPPYPGNVSYGDVMRYPGGLHGYGYVENMDGYGGYRSRQPAESAHMMLQQQYALHQRQIHHQMYHRPPPHEQQQQPQASPSFDGSFGGGVFRMPTNVFTPPPIDRTGSGGGASTSHSFPASPKMNPRAANFDPTGKSG